MKNRIIKSIITLLIAWVVMPMMGQDWMELQFKNGVFKKFYLKNVSSIFTSQYDGDGTKHSDFQYQHVVSNGKSYVYALSDIEYLSFTKYDGVKEKANVTSALTAIEPVLVNCNSIADAESKIEQIKAANGVEKAWSDGHCLNVKIAGSETITYHFNHDGETVSSPYLLQKQMLRAMESNTVKNNSLDLNVVIANQQSQDESRSHYVTDYYKPLEESFKACKITPVIQDFPDVEFFNSEIFNYDLIFLITHGVYNNGIHSILTSDRLGAILEDGTLSEDDRTVLLDRVRTIRERYPNAEERHIYLSGNHETHNNTREIVYHPAITEAFFDEIASGSFANPNSMMFNTACMSLKDNDGLANILRGKKHLGLYIGYDETNSVGKKAGADFLTNMLRGQSIGKAYENLSDDYKTEINSSGNEASLAFVPRITEESIGSRFLNPVYTLMLWPDAVNAEYAVSKTVTLEARSTALDIDDVTVGFMYGTDENLSSSAFVENVNREYDIQGRWNFKFFTTLSGLVPGQTYYYRAYLHDGTNYNNGAIYSFKIDSAPEAIDLGLASRTLWAPYNVGATKPEECGGYYAWGETTEKNEYNKDTYLYQNIDIGKDIAGTDYDVAHVLWGDTWMIPTEAQLKELFNSCSVEWTTLNGTKGCNLTGPNGKSIFMPVGGFKEDTGIYGLEAGMYWSSEYIGNGRGWTFDEAYGISPLSSPTYRGLLVRPVQQGSQDEIPSEPVDLGLPSGTKWALYNVGAVNQEDYGDYFAWGETEGKSVYDWTTYIHCDGTKESLHDIGDNLVGTKYDVAHEKWGGSWTMPTQKQFKELLDYCTFVWGKTKNNIYGIQATGPNGKKIFFPAGGCQLPSGLAEKNRYGYYWIGDLTPDSEFPSILKFYNSNPGLSFDYRSSGLCVRPVISGTLEP